jgi:hypothetical protein
LVLRFELADKALELFFGIRTFRNSRRRFFHRGLPWHALAVFSEGRARVSSLYGRKNHKQVVPGDPAESQTAAAIDTIHRRLPPKSGDKSQGSIGHGTDSIN